MGTPAEEYLKKLQKNQNKKQQKNAALSPAEQYLAKLNNGEQHFSPQIELARNQNKGLDNVLNAYGSKPKHSGPSILGRVFDVISRPAYASAEAINRSQKAQREGHGGFLGLAALDDAAKGFAGGISGKKKTSYSEVLAGNAEYAKKHPEYHPNIPVVKNKTAQTVLGLVGDIALDPSTYVTGGATKALSETDKAAQLTKAGAQALKTTENINTVKTAAKAARQTALLDAIKSGAKAPTKKELSKLARDAANNTRQDIIKAAQEAAKPGIDAIKPGTIDLKVGGRPVVQSEKAYDAAKFVKDKAKQIPGIKQGISATEGPRSEIAKLFSTKATYGPINEERKLLRARSVANYDDIVERYGLDKLNLTQQEAKDFSHAYEKGTSHLLGTSKHGIDYADLTNKVKKLNHELFVEEKAAGLIPEATPELDNYLYHIYGENAKATGFKASRKKAIASDAFKPAVERKIPTLADAAAKGLSPEQNIISIMKERAARSTQSLARRDLVAEAADKYGVQLGKQEAKAMGDMVNLKKALKDASLGANIDYLPDNVFVHKDIAHTLGNIERLYKTPDSLKHVVGMFDKVQNMWKTGVTVYSPAHHTRNLMSDVFLNSLDGVDNPSRYSKALELISGKGMKGTTKIGKDKLDNDLIMKLFHESGASPSFIQTEELSKGITHSLTSHLHGFAEKRESFGRLAHFIDSLDKEATLSGVKHGNVLTPELLDAAKKASARVRKWNVDYGDLTDFERNVMKRTMPFYTWLRKSTPLMVEAAATRPGRVAIIPKGLSAISKLTGGDPNDHLPVDMIPKWIREMGGVQTFTSNHGNPVFLAPNLPPSDVAGLGEGGYKGIISNLLAQTSPFIKAPIELGTGRTIFSGTPTPNFKDYLLQQMPYTRIGQSVTKNASDPANDNMTRIINFLTGAGLYEATPNRLAGEQRRQMQSKRAKIKKLKAQMQKSQNAG